MRDDETIGVDERALDDVALEALAEAYETPAPARLRARLLGAVRDERAVATAGTRRALARWRMVGAIAATIAVVTTGLLVRERARNESQGALLARQSAALTEVAQSKDALERRLDEQGRTLVGLREALDTQAQMLRVLSGPRTITASLAPNEGFAGSGRVLVDAESGEAHVVLSGLPSPGPGKTYELWAIRAGKSPEPAGLIAVGGEPATAARAARIAEPTAVAAFAVSIEPAAGSTSPTGPIVLVGKVT
jgi:anti-sigma-K factor RskA